MEYEYEQHLKKQLQPRPSQSVIDRKKMVLKKTVTIHEAAQAGDLKAVQVKLAENGALINLRNPIVRSTCSMFSQDDAFHETFPKSGILLVKMGVLGTNFATRGASVSASFITFIGMPSCSVSQAVLWSELHLFVKCEGRVYGV